MQFIVTDEHVKLLRAANVGWEGGEFGAPSIDCKRPYGNSSVYEDIARILGIKWNGDDFSPEQFTYMDKVHHETQTALQIFLATGTLEAGAYVLADRYGRDWVKV